MNIKSVAVCVAVLLGAGAMGAEKAVEEAFRQGVEKQFGVGVPVDEKAAVAQYRRAAEGGLAEAQYALGSCYYRGIGVEKDKDEALKHFLAAAKQGYAPAQAMAGTCYLNKTDASAEDLQLALKWSTLAAEQDDMRGLAALGYMYDEGKGVEKDEETAIRWYTRAAEMGYAPAQNGLGWTLLHGENHAHRASLAVEWYRKAAEQGNTAALTNLAWCAEREIGTTASPQQLVAWYRAAAEQGFAPAQGNMGVCYQYGKGVRYNSRAAAAWYRVAAENGSDFGAWKWAQCLEYGLGTRKNPEEAAKWFRVAAEAGTEEGLRMYGYYCLSGKGGVEVDPERGVALLNSSILKYQDAEAMNLLGECYERGIGVEVDIEEARRLYRRAVRETLSFAGMQNLARCAYLGIHCERDIQEALRWWTIGSDESYEAQDPVCINALAVCYELGEGVPQDAKKAFELYSKAALHGDMLGRYNLARCYELGIGTERDMNKAFEQYFLSASRFCFRPAIETLQRMGVKLDPVYRDDMFSGLVRPALNPDFSKIPPLTDPKPWRYFDVQDSDYVDLFDLYDPSKKIHNITKFSYEGFPPEKTIPEQNDDLVREGDALMREGQAAEAVSRYHRAAEQWSVPAMLRLAACSLSGQGLPRDSSVARSWILKAARQGGSSLPAILESYCKENDKQKND